MKTRGFTLIELLIALCIVAVIAAIVYATFATVINSVDATRVQADELRLREFLVRSFTTNFSTMYADGACQESVFQLVGTHQDGPDGRLDSIRFCSTAPIMGGIAMPGDFKEVRYEVTTNNAPNTGMNLDGSADSGGDTPPHTLVATETPLLTTGAMSILNQGTGATGQAGPPLFNNSQGNQFASNLQSVQAPSWSVPIRSMSIRYFDGHEWVNDWDSLAQGRLPWCVEIKINFARTQAQLDAESQQNIDPKEDPDLTLVLPIPIAMGTVSLMGGNANGLNAAGLSSNANFTTNTSSTNNFNSTTNSNQTGMASVGSGLTTTNTNTNTMTNSNNMNSMANLMNVPPGFGGGGEDSLWNIMYPAGLPGIVNPNGALIPNNGQSAGANANAGQTTFGSSNAVQGGASGLLH